jgi:four helix bundle protein
MATFDHEKLDVYKASIDFVRFVNEFVQQLTPNHRNARDQLIRASQSIPLNIAEGNAKALWRERTRFLEIARGSAMESAAALDILVACGACNETSTTQGKELLFRVVSMLSRMTENRRDIVKEETADYEHEHDYEHVIEHDEET